MNKRSLKSILAALVIASAPIAVSVVSAQSAAPSKPAATSSKDKPGKGQPRKGQPSKGSSKGDSGKGNKGDSGKSNSGKGDSSKNGPDGGRGMGGSAVFDATAKALGFSSDELRTQLRAGKTISELAKAKNISETAVHDAAVAGLKTQLETKVTAGKLTQAQADERLKTAQADATFGLQVGKGGNRR